MASKNTQSVTLESAMEVIELTQATELVQAMEARGDFKFKGVFALFNIILDWTNKFPSNGILPTMDQLTRESQLPQEKVREYLIELLGRGSSNARMIFPIPAVELIVSGGASLNKLLVFCRPLKADGSTVRRYIGSYVEKNYNVMSKWISKRAPNTGSPFTDSIRTQIDKGRLHDLQAGSEIARIFFNEFDTNAEERKTTYSLIARSVIQKLIATKSLLHIKPTENSFLPNYPGIYFNNIEEMDERFKILAGVFVNNIASDIQADLKTSLEIENVSNLASSFDRTAYASLSDGHKQVIAEILLLSRVLKTMQKDKKEKESVAELDKLLIEISKSGRLLDVTRMKKMNEDIRSQIMSSASLMHSEYPVQGHVSHFVLHQDSIQPAIKTARDRFDKTGVDYEIHVLADMGIEKLLNQDQQNAFQDLLQRTFFEKLPWYTRIWRTIFGNTKLKPEETEKLKRNIDKEVLDEKLKIRENEARKDRKKLISERIKSTEEEKREVEEKKKAEENPEEPRELEADEKQVFVERESEVAETLNQICKILDDAWEEKLLPGRTYLVEKLPGFSESALINFLKKHARKEIFSFRIKNEKPEYVWPILITKKYIKRHGRKMLQQAIKDSDEQRKANMPNQEKFDIASAIEEFLNKLTAKR